MIYYRKLFPADRPKIKAHFLRLSTEDRARRFHGLLSEDTVRAYCTGFDWSKRAVIGGFEFDRLVGIAEIVQTAPDQVEIAVSVEASYRHHGVGRELVRRAVDSAANRGASVAVLDYVKGDPSVPHIAASLGGHVDGMSGTAEITPPAHDTANEVEELLEDIAGAVSWAAEFFLWPLRLAARRS